MQIFRQQAVGSNISVEKPGGTGKLKICGLSSAKPQFFGSQMMGLNYNVAISVDTLKELLGGKIGPDSHCRIYINLESEKNYETVLSSVNELKRQFSAGADAAIYDNIACRARGQAAVNGGFRIRHRICNADIACWRYEYNQYGIYGHRLRTREFAMLKSVGITPKASIK